MKFMCDKEPIVAGLVSKWISVSFITLKLTIYRAQIMKKHTFKHDQFDQGILSYYVLSETQLFTSCNDFAGDYVIHDYTLMWYFTFHSK